jgi:hypothetical protein
MVTMHPTQTNIALCSMLVVFFGSVGATALIV